jgi:MFS family permease
VAVARRTLPLLYAATFANFCALGIFFVAIPLYVDNELAGSKAAVGLAVGAFSVSAVLMRPVIGRGIDRRGRRPFLLLAMTILILSSLSFYFAHSIAAVVAIRLLQGIAGASFYTTSATVTTDVAPVERRASAIAALSLFLYGGFATGPAIGEWLIDRGGFDLAWRSVAVLGVAGLGAVLLLPETGRGIMAVRAELGPSARTLLHPAAVAPGLVLMTTAVGYTSITAFSSLYAREIGLHSSGLLYFVFAVSIIAVRLLVIGGMADRRGHITVALPGVAIAGVGLAIMALFPHPASACIGVAGFGAGFALVFPALMAFTVDRVDDHERGEVLGSFTAFMDIGAGGGGFLIGIIADRAGFRWAYGTPALLCLCGLALLVALARRQHPSAYAHPEAIPVEPL